MKDDDIRTRKSELFSYFGIEEFKTKKIEELSTGMKQKAAIAVSLVHNPDIVILMNLQADLTLSPQDL